MKVLVMQENLNKALGVVSRMVSVKAQLPILNNILLLAKNGKLVLRATNLETGISFWLGGKVEEEGKLTVPAKILTEVIASMPQETIELKGEKEQLQVKGGKFRAQINGISAEEFPEIPSLKEEGRQRKTIRLDKKKLEKSLNQVAMAAATDESRPIFTGVKVELGKDRLRMAATDGYRLSVKIIEGAATGIDEKKELVIPAKALIELTKVIDLSEANAGEVELWPTEEEKQLILSFGEAEIVTRILSGEFPDFDKIIPQSSATKVEAGKDELEKAVRAAAVFARDSANIVKFQIKDEKMVISANAPQVGENEVEVGIKKEGENSEIAFNSRYLLEMLQAIEGERVELKMSGPLSPGLFQSEEKGFLHIIMPVRVQQ